MPGNSEPAARLADDIADRPSQPSGVRTACGADDRASPGRSHLSSSVDSQSVWQDIPTGEPKRGSLSSGHSSGITGRISPSSSSSSPSSSSTASLPSPYCLATDTRELSTVASSLSMETLDDSRDYASKPSQADSSKLCSFPTSRSGPASVALTPKLPFSTKGRDDDTTASCHTRALFSASPPPSTPSSPPSVEVTRIRSVCTAASYQDSLSRSEVAALAGTFGTRDSALQKKDIFLSPSGTRRPDSKSLSPPEPQREESCYTVSSREEGGAEDCFMNSAGGVEGLEASRASSDLRSKHRFLSPPDRRQNIYRSSSCLASRSQSGGCGRSYVSECTMPSAGSSEPGERDFDAISFSASSVAASVDDSGRFSPRSQSSPAPSVCNGSSSSSPQGSPVKHSRHTFRDRRVIFIYALLFLDVVIIGSTSTQHCFNPASLIDKVLVTHLSSSALISSDGIPFSLSSLEYPSYDRLLPHSLKRELGLSCVCGWAALLVLGVLTLFFSASSSPFSFESFLANKRKFKDANDEGRGLSRGTPSSSTTRKSLMPFTPSLQARRSPSSASSFGVSRQLVDRKHSERKEEDAEEEGGRDGRKKKPNKKKGPEDASGYGKKFQEFETDVLLPYAECAAVHSKMTTFAIALCTLLIFFLMNLVLQINVRCHRTKYQLNMMIAEKGPPPSPPGLLGPGEGGSGGGPSSALAHHYRRHQVEEGSRASDSGKGDGYRKSYAMGEERRSRGSEGGGREREEEEEEATGTGQAGGNLDSEKPKDFRDEGDASKPTYAGGGVLSPVGTGEAEGYKNAGEGLSMVGGTDSDHTKDASTSRPSREGDEDSEEGSRRGGRLSSPLGEGEVQAGNSGVSRDGEARPHAKETGKAYKGATRRRTGSETNPQERKSEGKSPQLSFSSSSLKSQGGDDASEERTLADTVSPGGGLILHAHALLERDGDEQKEKAKNVEKVDNEGGRRGGGTAEETEPPRSPTYVYYRDFWFWHQLIMGGLRDSEMQLSVTWIILHVAGLVVCSHIMQEVRETFKSRVRSFHF